MKKCSYEMHQFELADPVHTIGIPTIGIPTIGIHTKYIPWVPKF